MFKHKEQQQIFHQYGVVYKISCNCGSSYIDQTSRNLITRINNHDPSSKTPKNTDVARHFNDHPNHTVCFNNPIILARSDHWRKLLIKKTLIVMYLLYNSYYFLFAIQNISHSNVSHVQG